MKNGHFSGESQELEIGDLLKDIHLVWVGGGLGCRGVHAFVNAVSSSKRIGS